MPSPTDEWGIPFGPSGPASTGVAITKSDSTAISFRALWVGGAGDLSLIFLNDTSNNGAGTAVTIAAVPAGTLLPFAVRRVMAATTATLIVGLD
jgi:hypothetical protein